MVRFVADSPKQLDTNAIQKKQPKPTVNTVNTEPDRITRVGCRQRRSLRHSTVRWERELPEAVQKQQQVTLMEWRVQCLE